MPARPPRRPDEVSAGGVVVRRAPGGWEVCLIRVGTRWSVPKGNVEPGEEVETTAVREVSEETGLPLDGLTVRGTLPPSDYAYRRQGRLVFKVVHHFLIEARTAAAPLVPQVGEVDEAAWVPLDEASSRISYRDLQAALREARRLLDEGG